MTEGEKQRYQLRELSKKLVLLEGHLANFSQGDGASLCCHCGQKHALEIEALAEESVNILPELASALRELAEWARANHAVFERCDLDQDVATRLSGEARGYRLRFMQAMEIPERVPAPAPAQPTSSGVAAGAGSSPSLHLAGFNPDLLDGEEALLIHAIPEGMEAGGIVLDEARAQSRPCLRFRVDGGEIVFAKGVIGALTPEEQRRLCLQGFVEGTGEAAAHLASRVETFKTAAPRCRAEVQAIADPGDRVRAYVRCMAGALRAAPPAPPAPPPAKERPRRARRRVVQG